MNDQKPSSGTIPAIELVREEIEEEIETGPVYDIESVEALRLVLEVETDRNLLVAYSSFATALAALQDRPWADAEDDDYAEREALRMAAIQFARIRLAVAVREIARRAENEVSKANPEFLESAIADLRERRDEILRLREEQIEAQKAAAEAALRQKWGAGFRSPPTGRG